MLESEKHSGAIIIFTYLAIAAIAFANFRYMWAIHKQTTRPSLAATYVFIASLSSVLFSSMSLMVAEVVVHTLMTNLILNLLILIFVMFSKKAHKTFTTLEILSLIVVATSLLLWYLFDSPWFGFLAPVSIDTLGMILVLKKLNRDRGSEDIYTWYAAGFAYLFALFGLDTFGFKDLIFSGLNVFFCIWIAIKSQYGVK